MKTFAEKLNGHITYCNKIMEQVSRVILLAKEVKRGGYTQRIQ